MAFDAHVLQFGGYLADVDLSSDASLFTAVSLRPAQNVPGQAQGGMAVVAYDGTLPFYGILQNSPKQGEAATVMLIGISRCRVDTAFTGGTNIGPAASGKMGPQSGAAVAGLALQSAVVGDVATILLR